MNALFFDHGYLDGEPGDYSLTEKGKQYGSEQDHHRGTGGYSFYNANWTTRTWDDGVVDALTADMTADSSEASSSSDPVNEIDIEHENEVEDPSEGPSWSPVALGAVVLVLVGGAVVATSPRVHRWAGEKVKPRAQRTWRALTRRNQDDIPISGPEAVPSKDVEPVEMAATDVPDPGPERVHGANGSSSSPAS